MKENSFIPYLIPYFVANGTATYMLSKKNERKIIKNFDKIEVGKTTKLNINRIVPSELTEMVSIIEKNIDKGNLNNLYNNLRNVKIRKNFLMIFMGTKGKYDNKKNTIDYSIGGSLEHELIHLASAHYNAESDICQSGFVNYIDNTVFGKALNEGYTDLVTRRLFNKRTMFYDGEIRLIRFIELLFNKKELEKYFFNNDIVSFINHLAKYMPREEAIKFVISFDRGFEFKKQGNPIYKIIYTNLELKMCEIFKSYNNSLLKQIDYLNLLDETSVTKIIHHTKKRYLVKS